MRRFYFEIMMNDIYKHCTLCPRECGVDRTNGVGFCGAGVNPKIARAALHYWEEPCISGTRGSGTVFFSHCTMKCIYCQNRQISADGAGKEITAEELAEEFLHLQEIGAHNINLVTPTHYLPSVIAALEKAKIGGLNIPIVYNTGGYEKAEAIRALDGIVDVWLPDMKYFDDKYARKYSAATHYFEYSKKALAEMVRQCPKAEFNKDGIMTKGVIVRHLMLPGSLLDTKRIIDYLYNTYRDSIYISLMNQYTPTKHAKQCPPLDKTVSERAYDDMVNYCVSLRITNAFIQEGSTASESFIPAFSDEISRI